MRFIGSVVERLQRQVVGLDLLRDDGAARSAFAYRTFWIIVHGVACWLVGRRCGLLFRQAHLLALGLYLLTDFALKPLGDAGIWLALLASYAYRALALGVGVEVNERGHVVVDEFLRTANPTVWAVGDCIGGLQLAHLASAEGARAADVWVVADHAVAPSSLSCAMSAPRSQCGCHFRRHRCQLLSLGWH